MSLTTPEVASISGHRDIRMLMRYAHPMRQRIIEQMDKGERHPKKMSLVSLSQDTISLLNFASKKPLNPWEELLFDLRGR